MERICIAHRGFSSIAPENTMSAIRMAMEEPCVNWIEVDVQMTKDGVPILIHDYTLNRTTNGRGSVRKHTLAELKALDAGSWKSPFYAGEALITLDELLEAVKGRQKIDLEIKTQDDMYPGLEQKVIDSVKQFGMQNDVVLTSFDHGVLLRVKRIDPGIQTGLIVDSVPKDLMKRLNNLGCSFLSIRHRRLHPELVRQTSKQGIQIIAWTVDDRRRMLRIAALDRNIMICTNRPNVWRETFVEPPVVQKKPWWRFGR
ncbi:glycerophosphodiester phosphodiesterase [Paenibacillus sp. CAA11]|uniref:glycerophosphodiester phosphodiesterase n=1 Tax=Paenibacillus sp. CAA11 TaxID=1532905 RepID=UPI000D3D2161|nr:glycerophosphodiester phosphodiesterase family protein [Paenibacillus sp. CAA11]AWB44134.1 glycerophosphodiester phosphodiesterase [Paenibacillus sp. CAA11]